MSDIDTGNKFFVSMSVGGDVFILRRPGSLSRHDALNLAAWLVAMAQENEGEFEKLLEAVRNT